jgi:hypothetical protein
MIRRVLEEKVALTGGRRDRRNERDDGRQVGAPLPHRDGAPQRR